jgi:hypothetical protein
VAGPGGGSEEEVGLVTNTSSSSSNPDKEQGSESNNDRSAENRNGKGKDQPIATTETDEITRGAPHSGNPDPAGLATVGSQHHRGRALSEEAARPTAGREGQAESTLAAPYGQQGLPLPPSAPP